MSRKSKISGKKHQTGNRVSHAKNRTKHKFHLNLQVKKIFVPELNKYVKVKLTTREQRTIDKIGLVATLKKYGRTVADLVK